MLDTVSTGSFPSCTLSAGRNELLMREVEGEGPDWSEQTGR